MRAGVVDEIGERYVWWYTRSRLSGVWRSVYYVGRLCFPMGRVGLCKPLVYGEDGGREVVEL